MDSKETFNEYCDIDYKKLVPQLEDDLINFHLMKSLSQFRISKDLNIKRVFYRSISLFVSALGRAYGLRQNSSFGIIKELKRRSLIDNVIAQRLSLAVAVACHTRLVHYSSKKKQEDSMYEEDETIGGGKKLGELKKIININWLVKSLVTTLVLQEVLKTGWNVKLLAFILNLEEILLASYIMLFLGLNHELIRFGEHYYQKQSKLNIFQHGAFPRICYACRGTKQYEKCLKLINQYRKKFPKCSADTDSFLEIEKKELEQFEEFKLVMENFSGLYFNVKNEILCIEAECLFDLEQFQTALQKSDQLLTLDISDSTRCMVLLCNSTCKIRMKKYREGLSGLRDHLKLLKVGNEKNSTNLVVTTPQTLQYIAIALFIIGRKEQGLHRAREGLHYAKITKAISFYVDQFQDLVELFTKYTPLQFEMGFLGRENFHRY